MIEFIFMLTHNDVTVDDAREVLAQLRDTGLRYVGFKDIGASPEVLADVTASAHERGMEVMLEVVSTSVEDEMRSLAAALEIGVDWVLGGTNPERGAEILAAGDVRYCPFPGIIEGHPSVLKGDVEMIAQHAAELTARDGIYGVDLLAYRHESADPVALTRAVVDAADGPVIAAGSVASLGQIADLERAGAWGFTIGGAIFEHRLPGGPTIAGQVAATLEATGGAGLRA
ncbi:MAG: 1-(5-phosphoribosyl)-5-((5-phosphoribosylamino)methylideneamino)imidazole-4-carboxamide isomerase [Solirubrobacteraceae bacterium]